MVDIPLLAASLLPAHFSVLLYLRQQGMFDDNEWLQVSSGRPALAESAGTTFVKYLCDVKVLLTFMLL